MRAVEPYLYSDEDFNEYLDSKMRISLPYEARDPIHVLIFGVLNRLESASLSAAALFRARLYISIDAITRSILEGGVHLYGLQRVNDPLMYSENILEYIPESKLPNNVNDPVPLPKRAKGRSTFVINADGSEYRDSKNNRREANISFLLRELNERFNGINQVYQILSSTAHIDGTLKSQIWLDIDTDTTRSPQTITQYRKGSLSNITFVEERRVVARFEAVCIFTIIMIEESIAKFRP